MPPSVGHQKSFEKTSTTVVRQSPTTIRAGWVPSPLFQHVGQRLVPPMAGSYSHVGKLLRPFKKLAAVCIASLYYKIFQCIHWKYWSSIINHPYHHFLAWQWHWWQCWCAQALWDGRSSPTFSWCHFQLERPREAHGMPFTSAVLHLLFAVYLPGPRRCQQRLGQTTRKCARPPCQARPAIRFGDSLPTAPGVACHILPYSTGSGGQNAILQEGPAGCSTTGCWSNVGVFSNRKWGITNRGLFLFWAKGRLTQHQSQRITGPSFLDQRVVHRQGSSRWACMGNLTEGQIMMLTLMNFGAT